MQRPVQILKKGFYRTMERIAEVERTTKETKIKAELRIDGSGKNDISTGIPFFDHMLTLFSVHGFFDLQLKANGDIEVDYHHTVEDVGLVLGEALATALGERKGIKRYGYAVTPMDDAISTVAIDLSNRPFLVYLIPELFVRQTEVYSSLFKEFFRAFSNKSGMNLHINAPYGENDHHVIESIFKSFARSLDQATTIDDRVQHVHSSKGLL
jgi:imidazoleglycerol-phosphate dehydratase